MAGEGGLVWLKRRNGTQDHGLVDTARGNGFFLCSNSTSGDLASSLVSSFNVDGFGLNSTAFTTNAATYVSWSFRRAPGFFDIVTWTGDGVAGRQIPHNLGTTPGMIVVKGRSASGSQWGVWHRAFNGGNGGGLLNGSFEFYTSLGPTFFGNGSTYIAPTASAFTVNNDTDTNAPGATYVAYLFAQNPDLIDCGSYVGNGSTSGPVVTCGSGWTPQWVMIKRADSVDQWFIFDTARGISVGAIDAFLFANAANAEVRSSSDNYLDLVSSGFQIKSTANAFNASGGTYIYCAVRAPT